MVVIIKVPYPYEPPYEGFRDWLSLKEQEADRVEGKNKSGNKHVASILSSIRVGGITDYLAYRLINSTMGTRLTNENSMEIIELRIGYRNEFGTVHLNKNVYEMYGREAKRMSEEWEEKYPGWNARMKSNGGCYGE